MLHSSLPLGATSWNGTRHIKKEGLLIFSKPSLLRKASTSTANAGEAACLDAIPRKEVGRYASLAVGALVMKVRTNPTAQMMVMYQNAVVQAPVICRTRAA